MFCPTQGYSRFPWQAGDNAVAHVIFATLEENVEG